MERLALFSLVFFFVVDVSTSAIAQQAGDAGAGAAYAKQYCSKCHAIGDTEISPEPKMGSGERRLLQHSRSCRTRLAPSMILPHASESCPKRSIGALAQSD
jgi:hypothetical protein